MFHARSHLFGVAYIVSFVAANACTGHGFGVTGHEGPFLAEGDMREIRPGMVFTIEPGIYLPGIGGFRHSDTVLITEEGNYNMTPWPDTMEDLTLAV